MSVANILDPATGLIRDEYARQSTVIPNLVIPITPAATLTVAPAGPDAIFGATNTACSTGQIFQVVGQYSISSTAASVGGSDMTLFIEFVGPAGWVELVQLAEQIAPVRGTFSLTVKVPAGGNTSFSIAVGQGAVANVGTISCSLSNVYISEIQP